MDRRGFGDIKELFESNEGQHFAAQIEVIPAVRIGRLLGREFDAFDDHVERHDKGRGIHADQEAVDDGERQWQANAHGGADAFDTVDIDGAAQRRDVAADDVHADTAPGEVADLLDGGEAGHEDELVDFLVGQLLFGLGQAALDGFGQDAFAFESAAVVDDFDDDAAGVVIGVEA